MKAIPKDAEPIIAAVRRRWAELPKLERPPLDDPSCFVMLMTSGERQLLAELGYYPIPPQVIDPVEWNRLQEARLKKLSAKPRTRNAQP